MEVDEYERDSECEDYADYGAEGYHPVVLGKLALIQAKNSRISTQLCRNLDGDTSPQCGSSKKRFPRSTWLSRYNAARIHTLSQQSMS